MGIHVEPGEGDMPAAPIAVYVAGASSDLPRAKACIRALGGTRVQGGRVTHDWPQLVQEQGMPDTGLSPQQCAKLARDCLQVGVDPARIVWLLLPPYGVATTGAWTEYGYALALAALDDTRILVTSGPRVGIFWALSHYHFGTDAEALAFIRSRIRSLESTPKGETGTLPGVE